MWRRGSKSKPGAGSHSVTKTVNQPPKANPSSVPKIPELTKSESEVKKEPMENIVCPFVNCNEKLKIDGNAKFHLALHYYDAGRFTEDEILTPEDPDGKGRPSTRRACRSSTPVLMIDAPRGRWDTR